MSGTKKPKILKDITNRAVSKPNKHKPCWAGPNLAEFTNKEWTPVNWTEQSFAKSFAKENCGVFDFLVMWGRVVFLFGPIRERVKPDTAP